MKSRALKKQPPPIPEQKSNLEKRIEVLRKLPPEYLARAIKFSMDEEKEEPDDPVVF